MLQEAFEDAVQVRKALEDNPCPKTREDWAVARGVFRMQVVKQQTGNLNALRAEYFQLPHLHFWCQGLGVVEHPNRHSQLTVEYFRSYRHLCHALPAV